MTEQILLLDVDSKIPNLVLMKLSTYYKNKGCDVKLEKLGLDYYKESKDFVINAEDYNKVFASVIFTNNKDSFEIINCNDISIGGTGYDIVKKLPQEIDDCEEDYSIYPDNDISYGFITRGCIRNCSFCFVPKKEGMIHKYRDVNQIVKHKQVKFLDNNFLAYNGCEEIMEELIEKKIRCQFNQALDMRLITESKAELLSRVNYLGEYLFAFDNINDEELITKKLNLFKKYVPKDWKCKFFIYCNADMDIKDVLHRIHWCRKNKALPYLMRDVNCYSSVNRDFYIDLAAYCNQPSIFKKMTFDEFIVKRTKNIERQRKSSSLYEKKLPLGGEDK